MATRSWFRRSSVFGFALAGTAFLLAGTGRAGAQQGTMFTPLFSTTTLAGPDSLQMTFRSQQVYDDNLLTVVGANTHKLDGTYTYTEAQAQYTRLRSGSRWLLSAQVGGRVYERFTNLNAPSFDMKIETQQRLTRRFSVLARQRWFKTPQNGLEEPNPDETFPLMSGEDSNLFFLQRNQNVVQTSIFAPYQLTERTSLSFGGNFNHFHYSGAEVEDFASSDAYLNMDRHFTRSQTLGFGYDRQWLTFPRHLGRAVVDNFLFNYSNQIAPTFTITAFAGPALVRQFGQEAIQIPGSPLFFSHSLNGTSHAWVGGLAATKHFGHNAVQLKYMRVVTTGSGLGGATLRQTANVTLTRKMTARLLLGMNARYSHGTATGLRQIYHSYRVWPTLHYQVGPRLLFTASGGIERGSAIEQGLVRPGLNRGLFSIGLEYQFRDIALGR